jgi:hypothetical protein
VETMAGVVEVITVEVVVTATEAGTETIVAEAVVGVVDEIGGGGTMTASSRSVLLPTGGVSLLRRMPFP